MNFCSLPAVRIRDRIKTSFATLRLWGALKVTVKREEEETNILPSLGSLCPLTLKLNEHVVVLEVSQLIVVTDSSESADCAFLSL